jgi:BAI1-associated protein 3
LVDDFLGSVTFSLKDIPSSGVEQWFRLEKRSEKSEVCGQILLKLWLRLAFFFPNPILLLLSFLSTREEHRLSSTEDHRNEDFIFLDDEGLADVQQHKDLIRQLVLYEISRRGEPVYAFRGELPDPALIILHQHAIQSDLTELHQLMWLV